MVDVYLIRHAHVDYGVDKSIGADNPLTPLGLEMAARLAERAAGWDLQHLFPSTMPRARQTAAAMVRRLPGLPYLEMDELRELCAADLRGHPGKPLGDDLRTWSPEHFAYANSRLYERVERGWRRIEGLIADRELQRVAIVAHGGSINMLLRQFQAITSSGMWSCIFELDWTGVSALRYLPDSPRRLVLWVNDARHIDPLRHRLEG